MLYLDYSRNDGEWIPNQYGGRENLDAIEFLKRMNYIIYSYFPDTVTYAEESTAWPMVTRPVYAGGLGFGIKWNMGWMHDTLVYFSKDPIHRKFHQNDLTFSMMYAFTENFMLSLSHDEVVHGKGSLMSKMSGDDWQKFANLRLLLGYMFSHPGKKLLFMGDEFGQWKEWEHESSVSWDNLNYPVHQGIKKLTQDLNQLYRKEPALYEVDFDQRGFEWIDFNDHENSILSFIRRPENSNDVLLIVCNFTPVPRYGYRVGVPNKGFYKELINSDSQAYGGSGMGNFGGIETDDISMHFRPYSVNLTLPPLSVLIFKLEVKK
jgi:1,4-alpha-glucan branching enzyme